MNERMAGRNKRIYLTYITSYNKECLPIIQEKDSKKQLFLMARKSVMKEQKSDKDGFIS